MSLKNLPNINAKTPQNIQWNTPSSSMAKWDPSLVGAKSDSATIQIFGEITEDGWAGGVTLERVAKELQALGRQDVTVLINSPGGCFFSGLGIYNLLREHKNKVTIKVVGLAASAASVVAMAGDSIQVAKSGFLMIHNCWAAVIGNHADLDGAATVLRGFDKSMADIYAAASGLTKEQAAMLMDAETWFSGEEAVSAGFAHGLLQADEVGASARIENDVHAAIRRLNILMAKQGLPRSERRDLLKQIKGTPSATHQATPSAGFFEGISQLTSLFRHAVR